MYSNEILIGACIAAFVLCVGMFSSCTYYAGVDYNDCVRNSETAAIAALCKVPR